MASSIADRLAWQAKWRRRWHKWKRLFLLAFIVFVGGPILLAFTPYGPGKVKAYILKENPIDKPIQPWGTEYMYKMGRFYSITMREKEAMKCYEIMINDWYRKKKNRRKMKIPRREYWIGCAVFQYAALLHGRYRQRAFQNYTYFLEEFGESPDCDPMMKHLAEAQISRWRQGS